MTENTVTDALSTETALKYPTLSSAVGKAQRTAQTPLK